MPSGRFNAGESAVGTAVDVQHFAATPVGHEVRATAEARLPTAGPVVGSGHFVGGTGSERVLRRIRFGIVGVVPGVGVGLRIGTMFAAELGMYGAPVGGVGVGLIDPLAIS